MLTIIIIAEIIMTIAIEWGILHEDRLIAFERKIIKAVKNYCMARKSCKIPLDTTENQ